MIQKRNPVVDNLYAIGTLLVVLGHSHSSDWSTFAGTWLDKMIEFIYIFHMPLFFVIAGYLFMNSHSLGKNGCIRWITDKGIKLLTPYIVITLLAMIPKYYFEQGSFAGFNVMYLLRVLFQPRNTVWGHFWFIPVLFNIYVIAALIRTSIKNDRYSLYIFTIISSVIYFLPFYSLWFGFNDLKIGLLFFALGMISFQIAERKQLRINIVLRMVCIIAAGGLAMWKVTRRLQGPFINLGIAFVMLLAVYLIAEFIGENKHFTWVSIHNFTLYIYSWPFQAVGMVILQRLHLPYYLISIGMFTIGLLGPATIIWIYNKLKFLNNRIFDLVLGVK